MKSKSCVGIGIDMPDIFPTGLNLQVGLISTLEYCVHHVYLLLIFHHSDETTRSGELAMFEGERLNYFFCLFTRLYSF